MEAEQEAALVREVEAKQERLRCTKWLRAGNGSATGSGCDARNGLGQKMEAESKQEVKAEQETVSK